MILKMHTVSTEVSAKHPGCTGIEPHASKKKKKTRRQPFTVIGSGR